MIDVEWVSYHIARPPGFFGDQIMLRHLFDKHKEFRQHIGFTAKPKGAIVSMPLHHNEDHIDQLNSDIRHLDWVLLILTANEFGSDAYKDVSHPNMKIWLQTPKKSDEADRYLPIGYPSVIEPKNVISKRRYVGKRDWFFAGQITSPVRLQCVEELRKLPNGKLLETKGFNQGLAYDRYVQNMFDSKVIPCPSGPATPDTFRVYEALELGCIPIVDNEWYWDKVFGKNPLTALVGWLGLPFVLSAEVENYEERQKKIADWWFAYKEQLYFNLIDDIRELKANV